MSTNINTDSTTLNQSTSTNSHGTNSHGVNSTRPSSTATCTRSNCVYTPRFDLWEGSDEFVLYGDLPGVSPDDLEIEFEDGRLTVQGRVQSEAERKYVSVEYGIGDFYREFLLGESVNAAGITAELKNGVVTIHLPKPEASKPRRIEVQFAH